MQRLTVRIIAVGSGALLVVAAVFAVLGSFGESTDADAAGPADLLPDLDQETPSELALRSEVVDGRVEHRLGFRSAVRNVGAGPLIVEGSRPDESTSIMTVDQVIERVGASPRRIESAGEMRYTVSPDHQHWHYLHFDRYRLQRVELRPADGSGETLARDRKSGFCLGDRYRATMTPLPAAPRNPVYTGRCGLERPDLREMREGISVGYGDDYSAFLEGQDLPLDDLPAGRYVLVHRVNQDRGLAESSYANNAASVLFDLRWTGETPALRVLAQCPDTDRCVAP
jgi:hypothetical protein